MMLHTYTTQQMSLPSVDFLHRIVSQMEEANVIPIQLLHPLEHELQIFTDASNKSWGAHIGDCTARGVWSVPESKIFFRAKGCFISPK